MNQYILICQTATQKIEDDYFRPHDTAIISVPQKAPDGHFENGVSLPAFATGEKIIKEWVSNGHRTGQNGHNVSATISLHENEWIDAGEWMWNNRQHYNGLSVLPYDGGLSAGSI